MKAGVTIFLDQQDPLSACCKKGRRSGTGGTAAHHQNIEIGRGKV